MTALNKNVLCTTEQDLRKKYPALRDSSSAMLEILDLEVRTLIGLCNAVKTSYSFMVKGAIEKAVPLLSVIGSEPAYAYPDKVTDEVFIDNLLIRDFMKYSAAMPGLSKRRLKRDAVLSFHENESALLRTTEDMSDSPHLMGEVQILLKDAFVSYRGLTDSFRFGPGSSSNWSAKGKIPSEKYGAGNAVLPLKARHLVTTIFGPRVLMFINNPQFIDSSLRTREFSILCLQVLGCDYTSLSREICLAGEGFTDLYDLDQLFCLIRRLVTNYNLTDDIHSVMFNEFDTVSTICQMHVKCWYVSLDGIATPFRTLYSTSEANCFTTVPKTPLKDRPIATEPNGSMRMQLNIGSSIRVGLHSVGIDLKSAQALHRFLVSNAMNWKLATIDLKGASDSILHHVVNEAFSLCPTLLQDMNCCRSSYTEIDVPSDAQRFYNADVSPIKGESPRASIRLSKHSSMGNGYTFEMESALFWAVCTAAVESNLVAVMNDPTNMTKQLVIKAASFHHAMLATGYDYRLHKSDSTDDIVTYPAVKVPRTVIELRYFIMRANRLLGIGDPNFVPYSLLVPNIVEARESKPKFLSFWSLVHKPRVLSVHRLLYGVYVYGDDIICHQKYAPSVVAALETFGFTINPDKSFLNGKFFESCGFDSYNGLPARPAYARSLDIDENDVPYALYLHNAIRLYSHRRGNFTHCDVRFKQVCTNLLQEICEGYLPVPISGGDTGILQSWNESYLLSSGLGLTKSRFNTYFSKNRRKLEDVSYKGYRCVIIDRPVFPDRYLHLSDDGWEGVYYTSLKRCYPQRVNIDMSVLYARLDTAPEYDCKRRSQFDEPGPSIKKEHVLRSSILRLEPINCFSQSWDYTLEWG